MQGKDGILTDQDCEGKVELILAEKSCCFCIVTGAIIGDGDRKRAPFLVLGLAP